MKIPKRLEPLIEEGLIDEVIRPLMSGKEAAVYIVVSGGVLRCAKVYKDAGHRSFRQRSTYTEGRKVRDSRRARAMKRGSKYGQKSAEEDWQNAEVTALNRLAQGGVRVPTPFAFSHGVLIMELVLGVDGEPAPRLNDVALTEDEALEYHTYLVRQAVWMLCEGLIHGDLSEYNILLGAEGPVIIDLPQAVEAAGNNSARSMLLRDVGNLAAYFSQYAPSLAGSQYGKEIWRLYERGQLHPDTPLTGKVAPPKRKANVKHVLREIDAERDYAQRRGKGGGRQASRGQGSSRGRGPSGVKAREEARLRGRLDDTWVDPDPPQESSDGAEGSRRGRRVSDVSPTPRSSRRSKARKRSPRRGGDHPGDNRGDRPPRRRGDRQGDADGNRREAADGRPKEPSGGNRSEGSRGNRRHRRRRGSRGGSGERRSGPQEGSQPNRGPKEPGSGRGPKSGGSGGSNPSGDGARKRRRRRRRGRESHGSKHGGNQGSDQG